MNAISLCEEWEGLVGKEAARGPLVFPRGGTLTPAKIEEERERERERERDREREREREREGLHGTCIATWFL